MMYNKYISTSIIFFFIINLIGDVIVYNILYKLDQI